jgi:hypothetical protein
VEIAIRPVAVRPRTWGRRRAGPAWICHISAGRSDCDMRSQSNEQVHFVEYTCGNSTAVSQNTVQSEMHAFRALGD